MAQQTSNRLPALAAILFAAVVLPLFLRSQDAKSKTLVVYCAHDSIFADSIIQRFEQSTGIHVLVRYDEEANKSLGLTNLLIAEKHQPRCDVFWNNQTLGTIRLRNEGVLQPCDPSLFARIPQQFRDSDNQWAGFAARLRVYIVNTSLMSATEDAVQESLASDSLSQAAVAVPLFGTTLSHYAVLCDEMGFEELKAWHRSLRERGIREARGNGAVKDLVAEGACQFGFTDTDDVFVAIDQGKPVKMLPVRLKSGKTICLPNSVAKIKACPHPELADKFIRYLLSEEVEILLANSASRQIPLGPVDETRLPDDLQPLLHWAADGVSLDGAAQHDQEVLNWLTQEYSGK